MFHEFNLCQRQPDPVTSFPPALRFRPYVRVISMELQLNCGHVRFDYVNLKEPSVLYPLVHQRVNILNQENWVCNQSHLELD